MSQKITVGQIDSLTATAAELNILDGVTATAAELNILDGVTATTAEINILDGVTATTAELNYVDGVTSNIQTQLDGKQASGSYLTGNQTITLSGDASGSGTTSIVVTVADDSHNHIISNVDGLQTALDAKLNSSSDTINGVLTVNSTNDAQILLTSTDTWTGIGFNDSGGNNEYIWHNGENGTFAIGGGGANVSGKKLHVDGGMSIGASSDSTSVPANGLYVEGAISVGGNTVWHAGNDGAGSGLDADLLDGISSASFLRSDTSDSFTSLTGSSLDVSGELEGQYIGVGNTSSTTGYGLSLYGGGIAGQPTYGIMFQGTSTFGTHGQVNGDWATYFTMNDTSGRGWIFRDVTNGNKASIENTGYITAERYYAGGASGYFFNDSGSRTAYTGGDLYIQSGVSNYYNYATNQYHGNTSGDNHYFRGNTLSGNSWSINSAGTFTGISNSAKYADLAERYTTDSDYEAGTVVVFGGEEEVTQSTQRLDRRVAGIVSTDPAYLMNSELENSVSVGLQGRVPCKVVGEIRKGDMMVTSSTPGHAEAWREESNPPMGGVIGKALENKTGAGADVIEVVVGRL